MIPRLWLDSAVTHLRFLLNKAPHRFIIATSVCARHVPYHVAVPYRVVVIVVPDIREDIHIRETHETLAEVVYAVVWKEKQLEG